MARRIISSIQTFIEFLIYKDRIKYYLFIFVLDICKNYRAREDPVWKVIIESTKSAFIARGFKLSATNSISKKFIRIIHLSARIYLFIYLYIDIKNNFISISLTFVMISYIVKVFLVSFLQTDVTVSDSLII